MPQTRGHMRPASLRRGLVSSLKVNGGGRTCGKDFRRMRPNYFRMYLWPLESGW